MKAFLVAALLAAAASLAGCEIDEAAAWGTVMSVQDAAQEEDSADRIRYDDHPLVPEVGWKIVVQPDDGTPVTVIRHGRRYEPGERVRLFMDDEGTLLL